MERFTQCYLDDILFLNFQIHCASILCRFSDYNDDEGELDLDSNKRDETSEPRGVSFGTALGHGNNGNNDKNKARDEAFKKIFGGKRELRNLKRSFQDVEEYMNDLERAFMTLGDGQQKRGINPKRAPFTFGTALGHNQGKNKGDYTDSLNKKFNELFGDS